MKLNNRLEQLNSIQYRPVDIASTHGKSLRKRDLVRKSTVKILDIMKAGMKIATWYLIGLYFLSIAADMVTTYIASPDLKYEGNIYVRYFGWGWQEIIIFGSLHALLVSSLFLVSLNFIHTYYRENNLKTTQGFISEIIHRKKLLLSFFMFGYFYKHLLNSVFISFNNYLGYAYIFKIENGVTKIFNWYINLQLKLSQNFFLFCLELTFVLAAIILTLYLGRKISHKYRAVSA